MKKVAEHDAIIVHNMDIPYVAPAFAITVTLLVPMLKLKRKILGRMNVHDFVNLSLNLIIILPCIIK